MPALGLGKAAVCPVNHSIIKYLVFRIHIKDAAAPERFPPHTRSAHCPLELPTKDRLTQVKLAQFWQFDIGNLTWT